MGQPIEPGNEPVQGGNPDAGDNTPGPNPAWNDVLSLLPEQFHQTVTPHFQKWDQAAQARIEAANTSLKEFEDFKPLLEHGITFDEVSNGLRLAYEINNNPKNVYDALAEAYKYGAPVAPTPVENEEGEESTAELIAKLPPEIQAQLQQQGDLLQTVSQIVLNDANAKQAAIADTELDRELADLKEKHGEYDEDYVLTKMLNGATGEEAVAAYQAFVQRVSPKPFAPTLLGAGSGGGAGIPSNAIDPTTLSGKDTRNLVVQMLAQAAKNQ